MDANLLEDEIELPRGELDKNIIQKLGKGSGTTYIL